MSFHNRLLTVDDIHPGRERVNGRCHREDALAVDGIYIIYRCTLVADSTVDGRLVVEVDEIVSLCSQPDLLTIFHRPRAVKIGDALLQRHGGVAGGVVVVEDEVETRLVERDGVGRARMPMSAI